MATRKFHMISAQESGIGGYLLLFVITQFVSLLLGVWRIAASMFAFSAPLASSNSTYIPYVTTLVILQTARGLMYALGLMLIVRRDPRTRTYYLWALGFLGATAVFEGWALRSRGAVGAICYCVVWFFYWRESERVRLTFAQKTS